MLEKIDVVEYYEASSFREFSNNGAFGLSLNGKKVIVFFFFFFFFEDWSPVCMKSDYHQTVPRTRARSELLNVSSYRPVSSFIQLYLYRLLAATNSGSVLPFDYTWILLSQTEPT